MTTCPRMRTHLPLCCALSFAVPLLILAEAPLAAAPGRESKDVVKVTATAGAPDGDGKQTVTITLDIDKAWHLYANPVRNDLMTDVQTVVKILANSKELANAQIKYAKGKEIEDPTVGNYNIYQGKLEITAIVSRAKGDTSPLEVSLQIFATSDSKNLLPSSVRVLVDTK